MNKKTKTTLLSALPIVLILGALAAAIVFFPESKDIRPRASDPTIFNKPADNTPQIIPEEAVGCSDLYQPVCGVDGITYDSPCEAAAAGVEIAYSTSCVVIKDTPNTSPTPTTTKTLPTGPEDPADETR